MTPGDIYLLRIYVTAVERRGGKLLYELIVRAARSLDLAGASVFPVEMSFGASRHVHDTFSDYGFAELPVVVEIVETRQRIEALLDRAWRLARIEPTYRRAGANLFSFPRGNP